MAVIKGIDVSYYQGNIDWKKVKESGISFAILRAGYGKSTVDKKFVRNIEECIKYNIPVGVYWFIYATNIQEVLINAQKCMSLIAPYKDKITMKVWCDFEYDTDANAKKRGVVFTKEMRTSMVKAFCDAVKSGGYEVGVYANPDYLNTKFNDLSMYPLWLAKYSSTKGDIDCDIWQYSSKGKVNGISGYVDMNIYYGDTIKVIEYYPKPNFTLLQSLEEVGAPIDFASRAKIASANGITNYKGTSEQNLKLLDLLNNGKLIKP